MVFLELCDVETELIAFREDAFPAGLDEGVEFEGEFGHAVAEGVEVEVDLGEGVG